MRVEGRGIKGLGFDQVRDGGGPRSAPHARQRPRPEVYIRDKKNLVGDPREGAFPQVEHVQPLEGSGFKVQGSGCRVQGSGFRVQGLGFEVES